MDLKEKLMASFMAFENQVDMEHPVHDIRSEAIKNFEKDCRERFIVTQLDSRVVKKAAQKQKQGGR